MNKSRIYILSSVIFLVAATVASAGIIGTVDLGPSTATWTSPSTIIGGGYTVANPGQVRGGLYALTPSNGTGAGVEVPGYAFCIDIPQPPIAGSYEVRDLQDAPLPENIPLNTPMSEEQADLIRELWGKHFDAEWMTNTSGSIAESLDDKRMAEAMGIAIWEIVYETSGTLDTTGGVFSATDVEYKAIANGWLAGLTGNTDDFADLVALSNLTGQDFVTVVPEPATMAILALGGLGLLRRKKS